MTTVEKREEHSTGDVAWVISRTLTTGQFRARAVNVEGVETMLLVRSSGAWRIVHIHWSSRARTVR
jgi:ketosteroid isomerase-like protein